MAKTRPKSQARLYPQDNKAVSFTEAVQRRLMALAEAAQGECVIAAAAAGAEVLYKEMRFQVPVAEGKLHNAIYIYRDRTVRPGTARFYVGPNKKKAPHWAWTEFGHWLYNRKEGGFWLKSKSSASARGPGAHTLPGRLETPRWVPPNPFIRRTWLNARDAAFRAARKRMAEKLTEVMRRR